MSEEYGCSGCAHERTDGKKGLKKPSGETACCLCLRNPALDRKLMNEIVEKKGWIELDVNFPIDMYCSLDRLMFLDLLAQKKQA